MKTLEIRIKSRERADAEFASAFKAGKARKGGAKAGVFFTSLEAVRALLTDKRMGLLRLIREHAPRSINQLASLAGRDFKNVHTDVMLLKRYGLVQLGRRGKTAGAPGPALSVPYGAIHIHAVV